MRLEQTVGGWEGRWSSGVLSALLLMILLLAGCGGGVGTNGTGAAPQSAGTGTVTGFGSVIIDGVAYDDSQAQVLTDAEDGEELSEVKLGQRVHVDFEAAEGAGKPLARRISVQATLRGVVESVDGGTLFLLGQTVSVNIDAAEGPVTVLEGFSTLSELVGQGAEIHALEVDNAGVRQWQATRIEAVEVAGPDARMRVSGRISALNPTHSLTRQFSIGPLRVSIEPSRLGSELAQTLADGQMVRVLARLSGYDATRSTLAAQRVQLLVAPQVDAQASLTLTGLVSGLDELRKTFELDGQKVGYASALLEPSSATLRNRRYVVVVGQRMADGSLQARSVLLPQKLETTELHGTVMGFDATGGRFQVRNTWVRFGQATQLQCDADELGNGAFVEVYGVVEESGTVMARKVHCEEEQIGQVVERYGEVREVKPLQRQFVLRNTDRSGRIEDLTVQWSSSTYFRSPLSAGGPALGDHVEVEGRFSGSGASLVFQASKIKPD